ncbi:MAG: pitrilysin family protein [Verrucomicrobia bacterium]|nr:pitrilysin family protein [Verrucomicrobiota bacterium]
MNTLFRSPLSALRVLPFVLGAVAALTASAQVARNAVRQSVGGIDLVVMKTGVQEVVTIRGSLAAGDSLSPDTNPALADLTGGMLDKGTTKHDKYAIAQLLGDVGANISFSTGPSSLNINGKCLKKDLPLVISLIAEQLRTPAFSPEEFAKLKKQFAGQYRRQLDDTDFRADDAYTRAIYPAGHPNRQAPGPELLAGAEKTTLDDVKAFYAKYYGPVTLRLVLVGDVDPAAAQGEVAKGFAGWTGGDKAPKPAPARAGGVDAARDQNVFMPEKTNVSVVWGQPTGLRYADTDTLALRVGTAALGSGFTGRLMANVRDKEGLTYGIGSYVAGDTFVDGDWRIQGNFAPAMLEKGIESTKRQLTEWYKNGITDAELAQRKTGMAGTYKVGLSTTAGMAGTILATLNRELDLAFIDTYPARVGALTKEQVNGAIKKHLDPEKMVIIKAGTVPGAK